MLESLLDQLARKRGIGDAYHNYRGDLMTISAATKRALLVAMGCPVDDAGAVEDVLREHDAERWRSLLEPVAVVHPGRDSVTIGVAVAALERDVSFTVQLEHGGERHGRHRAADLHECERAEVAGHWQTRRALPLPVDLPHGYHTLQVAIDGGGAERCALIVAPRTCFEPSVLRTGERLWGVAVQLYTLRSARNWGIGDFADIEAVVRGCAPAGAAFVGLNPLHALFPSNPGQFSPYSASSRHFLNVLYLAVEALPEYAESEEVRALVATPEFQAELARLRATEAVDYHGVARAKFAVLERLFAHFQREHLAHGTDRARAYAAFKTERGATLRLHALHDALDEHLRQRDPERHWGWPAWPEELRDPAHVAVAAFAREHADRVEYYAWLQWLADDQLRAVQTLSRDLGMAIGLYGDYAVGVNPCGAETWSDQALYRKGAGVGAPPDALALKGQDWGIPPQDPNVLRAEHYQPIRRLLAASLRNFGALRIDHVMAFFRQWWVPVGLGATDGGYVHYPIDDLMSVLALESERHHCLIVGEDLGTVPPEMGHAMAERAVYSYRVLLFEKHGDGTFRAPGDYPRRAIATVTTHDLPTLKGYWTASDIELRQRLALYPSDEMHRHVLEERVRDRHAMLAALRWQGLLPEGFDGSYGDALAHAIQVYLARSASALVVLQAEDLAGMADPVNVPGTSHEHANWQRKMSADLLEVFARPHTQRLFEDVRAARA